MSCCCCCCCCCCCSCCLSLSSSQARELRCQKLGKWLRRCEISVREFLSTCVCECVFVLARKCVCLWERKREWGHVWAWRTDWERDRKGEGELSADTRPYKHRNLWERYPSTESLLKCCFWGIYSSVQFLTKMWTRTLFCQNADADGFPNLDAMIQFSY